MQGKLLRYTLRVDRLLFKKFRYIAEAEGRSANKEIEQFLKKRVAEFEQEHGEILIGNTSDSEEE
ncbi:MAG TPA: TraY domain-containing protein [Candidatus Merdivicinus intestinigallinarum]|nr:TraY domain-containing protein [Candidatus Merdivicinus intestinigallinarum]